jgi:exodeoxyribonuclease-3
MAPLLSLDGRTLAQNFFSEWKGMIETPVEPALDAFELEMTTDEAISVFKQLATTLTADVPEISPAKVILAPAEVVVAPQANAQKAISKKAASKKVSDNALKKVIDVKVPAAKPASAAKIPKLQYDKANVGCSYYTNDHSIEPAFHPDNHDAMEIGDVLAIVNWNCRSLRNALTKTKTYLPFEVGCYDVVVLTETQSDLASLMKHARFNMCVSKYPWSFWNTCLRTGTQGKQGSNGVGVLCRKRPLAVQYGFGETEDEKDGRVTVVRWKDAAMVAVYAPASLIDGMPERILFYDRLCKLVAKESVRCPIFVVGDLNVPLHAADVSHVQPWLKGATRVYGKDREDLQNLITANKLADAGEVGIYTWFPEPTVTNQGNRIGMRLDYFLLPAAAKVYRYYVLAETTSSDHRPVVCEFSLSGQKEGARQFQRRALQEFTFMTLSSTYSLAAQMEVLAQVVEKLIDGKAKQPAVALSAGKCMTFDGLDQPNFRQVGVDPTILDRLEADILLDDLHGLEMQGVHGSMTRYFQCNYGRRDGVPPPRVEIYLGEHHHYGLVDTGSDLCLVDYYLAYKHVPNFEQVFVPLPNFTLQLGDGETKMCVVGRIYLEIAFLNELHRFMIVSQWFYCTTALPDCFVVGDALFKDQRARQADISQYHRSMQLDGVQIPYKNMLPHFHLYVDAGCEIPPHVEASVRLNVGRSHGSDGVCCSGHVFDRVMDQNLTIVEAKAYTCIFGFVQITLLNTSNTMRRVVKGQSVACFQACEGLRDATHDERNLQFR